MKLHLPVFLRKSILAVMASAATITFASGTSWADTYDLLASGDAWAMADRTNVGSREPVYHAAADGHAASITTTGWGQALAVTTAGDNQMYTVGADNTLTFTMTMKSTQVDHAVTAVTLTGSTQTIALGVLGYETSDIKYGLTSNTTADIYFHQGETENWESGEEYHLAGSDVVATIGTRTTESYTLQGVVTLDADNAYTMDLSINGKLVADDVALGKSFNITRVTLEADGGDNEFTNLTITGALAYIFPCLTYGDGTMTWNEDAANTPFTNEISRPSAFSKNDRVIFNGTDTANVTLGADITAFAVTVADTATVNLQTGDFALAVGGLTVNGTLNVAGQLDSTGDITIGKNGTLDLKAGSTLLLPGGQLTFLPGTVGTGTISLSDHSTIAANTTSAFAGTIDVAAGKTLSYGTNQYNPVTMADATVSLKAGSMLKVTAFGATLGTLDVQGADAIILTHDSDGHNNPCITVGEVKIASGASLGTKTNYEGMMVFTKLNAEGTLNIECHKDAPVIIESIAKSGNINVAQANAKLTLGVAGAASILNIGGTINNSGTLILADDGVTFNVGDIADFKGTIGCDANVLWDTTTGAMSTTGNGFTTKAGYMQIIANGGTVKIGAEGEAITDLSSLKVTYMGNDATLTEDGKLYAASDEILTEYVVGGTGANATVSVSDINAAAQAGDMVWSKITLKEGTTLDVDVDTAFGVDNISCDTTATINVQSGVTVTASGTGNGTYGANYIQNMTGNGTLLVNHDTQMGTQGAHRLESAFAGTIEVVSGTLYLGHTGIGADAGAFLNLGAATIELNGGDLRYFGRTSTLGALKVTQDATLGVYGASADGLSIGGVEVAKDKTLLIDRGNTTDSGWAIKVNLGALTGEGHLNLNAANAQGRVFSVASAGTETTSFGNITNNQTINLGADGSAVLNLGDVDNRGGYLNIKGQLLSDTTITGGTVSLAGDVTVTGDVSILAGVTQADDALLTVNGGQLTLGADSALKEVKVTNGGVLAATGVLSISEALTMEDDATIYVAANKTGKLTGSVDAAGHELTVIGGGTLKMEPANGKTLALADVNIREASTLYVKTASVQMGAVSMEDGSSLTLFRDGAGVQTNPVSSNQKFVLDALSVTGTTTLKGTHHSACFEIGNLAGSGTLNVESNHSSSIVYSTFVNGEANFAGTVNLSVTDGSVRSAVFGTADHDALSGTVVNFAAMTNSGSKAGFILANTENHTIQVAGLSTAENIAAGLALVVSNDGVSIASDGDMRTLEIVGSGEQTFAGTVLAGVSLLMNGEGTQTFAGNMDAFNGSVEVQKGTLNMASLGSASSITLSGAGSTLGVYTMTHLYGGRLRVEDGAIYAGYGITAEEGSASTVRVKDATLDHQGYALTFNAGTTLELEGTNSVSGNIQMLEGSTLRFIRGMDVLDSPGMTLSGSLTLCDSVTLQMVGFGTGNYLLMDVSGATLNGWNTDALTFIDEDGAQLDSSLFVWDGDVLYYVNGEALNLAWTNADGNGAWDDYSPNWESEGTIYASSLLNNVSFGVNAGETITLSGQLVVNKMTVQQGGRYTFAEGWSYGPSLTVRDKLTLEAGAFADIQLRGGVKVDGALESAGELKVNKVTGAGLVSISGGSLELADDVDALAVTGTVSITNAELRGEWTGIGLSIGNSSVAAGADVTLKDVTISSTLSNEGNLVLGGTVTVQADGLDAPTSTTKYSAGESGYRYQEYAYTLVTGDGSSRALNGTQWDVQGGEMGTYSYADGVLSVTGAQDQTQYWVNGIVTYDGRAEFDSANTLVLNGGHLNLTTGLGSNLSQGIRVDASGTLTLGSGVQLGRGDITGMSTDNVVTLQGSGSLNLGASADFAGYSLGKEWAGTVKLANISSDTNLMLDTIGQAGSTIVLENVMGYTGVNGKTVAANLVLTRSYDANGAEQAAFCVSNGLSDESTITFSGTVSGAGKMVFAATQGGAYTGAEFMGDVSGWTGAFEMNTDRTFNLVFGGNGTEINADIRDASENGTLNLILQADGDMSVNGDVVTDSISVTNGSDVSFLGMVNTGGLTAENSNITIASETEVRGDMTVAGLQVQSGSFLTVGGTLCAADITLDTLSANSPWLEVGQFGAGDTIFHLEIEDLNALNLGHGESVTIARAENAIGSDFNAWLGEGTTSLDAAVYRYDISVSGTDVQVSMDYANWGMRVWYQNGWVGKERWDEYLVAGYDAVDGTETVDLGGETLEGVTLLIAPGAASATTVMSNGEMVMEMVDLVDGSLQIAEDATLDATEIAADGKEIHLLGELLLSDGRIGRLSGTTGELSIASGGEVSIDSNVTLGSLANSGTLDIGKNKLNVAAAVTTGGNVIAGEVVVHNRANKAAVFNALVADKVTVTNSLSSNSYKDAISLGDGSVIGELIAETLEVRGGTVTLGRTEGSTSLTLQGLDLQNDATLLLNQQTQLAVTESMSATENATVQLKQGAGISYGATSISNGGQVETTTVNAYELATGNLKKVENAHVAVDSDADTTVDYQLVNATLEKRGKGTLTVTSEGNSINAVSATGGTINVMNVASSDLESIMKLASLELHGGATFGAYTGDTADAAQEAWVQVSGSAVFGSGTTINADLELMEGCSLTLGGTVDMGSNLRINGSLTLNGDLLAQIQAAEIGASFDLFTGIDNLYLSGVQYDSIALSDGMAASTYFVGLEDSLEAERGYRLTYASATPGEGVLSVHVVTIPEPTTATLSLLALAALVARRRRSSR